MKEIIMFSTGVSRERSGTEDASQRMGWTAYLQVSLIVLFIVTFNILNLRETVSADFNLDVFPYGKVISVAFLVAAGALSLNRAVRVENLLASVGPALFLLVWFLLIDHYQSKIFGRAESQLSKFPIFVFLGYFFARFSGLTTVYLVLLLSWAVISSSVVVFAVIPEVISPIGLLSEHFWEIRDSGSGVSRNAGILLNNNAFGAIYIALTICLLRLNKLMFPQGATTNWMFLIAIYVSFLAGNATAFLLLGIYYAGGAFRRGSKVNGISNFVLSILLVMSVLVSILGDITYVMYKVFDSGLVKLPLFLVNIEHLVDGVGLFVGHPERAFWSESSLVNALYEVGVFQFSLFIVFLFSLGAIGTSQGLRVRRFAFKESLFVVASLILVAVVQNSAFAIPAALAYGLYLGKISVLSFTNRSLRV